MSTMLIFQNKFQICLLNFQAQNRFQKWIAVQSQSIKASRHQASNHQHHACDARQVSALPPILLPLTALSKCTIQSLLPAPSFLNITLRESLIMPSLDEIWSCCFVLPFLKSNQPGRLECWLWGPGS